MFLKYEQMKTILTSEAMKTHLSIHILTVSISKAVSYMKLTFICIICFARVMLVLNKYVIIIFSETNCNKY